MNVEIENKFRIQSCDVARREIETLGAQFKGESQDIDVYYTASQEKPGAIYLRIRTSRDKSILALHEVVDDLTTKEWETTVEDGKIAGDILRKLGFNVDVTVDKTRQCYALGESEILLDHIEGLGDLVEIESPTEQKLDAIAAKITLGEQIIGKGYPDLLKDLTPHPKQC